MAETNAQAGQPADTDGDFQAEAVRLHDEDAEFQKMAADLAKQQADQEKQMQQAGAPADKGTQPFDPWDYVKRAAQGGDDTFSKWAHRGVKVALEAPLVAADPTSIDEPLGGSGDGVLSKIHRSVVRGVMNAAYNTESVLVNGGVSASVKTGLYKWERTPEQQKEFLDWYNKPTKDWQADIGGVIPVMPSRATMDSLMPPKEDGVYGFVEGLSQFAAGMLATRASLSNWATTGKSLTAAAAEDGVAMGALKAGGRFIADKADTLSNMRFAKGAISGAVTQMTAFDPYEKRLSNMIESGPAWFSNPVTRALQADPNDGQVKARLKNALEGYISGQVLEGVLHGVSRLFVKGQVAAGKITTQAGEEALTKLEAEAPESTVNDTAPTKVSEAPARVVQDENGFHNVVVEDHQPEPTPTPTTTPTPHDLAATPENTPRPLDFEHVKVANVADITPDVLTVGRGEDGKPLVRAIQNGENGAPPKVFESPMDPETIKALHAQNPDVSVHTPMRDNPMTSEEFKAWTDNALPRNEGRNVSTGEDPTGIASPKAKDRVVAKSASRGKAEAQAAQVNYITKNVANAGDAFVSENDRKGFMEAFDVYRKTKDPRSAMEVLQQYGVNPSYVQQPKEALAAIKGLVDQMPMASEIARGRPTTFQDIRSGALKMLQDLSGKGTDEVMNHVAGIAGGLQHLPEFLDMARIHMWQQAGNVAKLTRLVGADPENGMLVQQQMEALDYLFRFHSELTGSQTKVAQALAGMRQVVTGDDIAKIAASTAEGADGATAKSFTTADRLAATLAAGKNPARAPGTYPVVQGMTRNEVQALGRMVSMAGDDLEPMLKLITGPRNADLQAAKGVPQAVKTNWGKFVATYHAEALLSAPSTHLGNVISNMGMAAYGPAQRIWGGFWENNDPLYREGTDMMKGIALHWSDSAKAATRAFMTGQNLFDGTSKIGESGAGSLQSLEASAMNQGSLVGNLSSAFFRLPSRLLMTSDEFFKHLNARAYTRAKVLGAARAEGVTDAGELAQRVTDAMKIGFDPERGAIFPDAIRYAKEATFQDDLSPTMQAMNDLIQRVPGGKVVMPFFRTPANIFMRAWEQTPGLNMFNKQMASDLAAGGEKAAIARSKSDFGSMIFGLGAFLALNGKLTGAGSLNPQLRQQEIAAGYQPYSITIGGKQISYRRGDPFTEGLSLTADLVKASGEMQEDQRLDLSAAAMSVFVNNITNKTFMSGLSDFLDAMSDETGHGATKFLKNEMGSFVPSVLVKSSSDNTVREAREWYDKTLNSATMPWNNPDAEPRRNIFGEPVMKPPEWANRLFNPFTFMPVPRNEDVQTKLLQLGKAMPMPPTTWGSIDLTNRDKYGADRMVNGAGKQGQSPYDRMLEMLSQPMGGGPKLRDAVENMMGDPQVSQLPDTGDLSPGGSKYMVVAKLISDYQEAAKKRLLLEYPTLRRDYEAQKNAHGASIQGGRPAAEATLQKYQQMFVKPAPGQRPPDPVPQNGTPVGTSAPVEPGILPQ